MRFMRTSSDRIYPSLIQMGSAVNFLFTDYTRLTSLGGETSLSMMLATLGDAIEKVTISPLTSCILVVKLVIADDSSDCRI